MNFKNLKFQIVQNGINGGCPPSAPVFCGIGMFAAPQSCGQFSNVSPKSQALLPQLAIGCTVQPLIKIAETINAKTIIIFQFMFFSSSIVLYCQAALEALLFHCPSCMNFLRTMQLPAQSNLRQCFCPRAFPISCLQR